MEFEFTGYLYVEEGDIKQMRKKIRDGADPDEVFRDWSYGLDDSEYYVVDYVRDQIMRVITAN